MLFCHRPIPTKAGQKLVSTAHSGAGNKYFFIAGEGRQQITSQALSRTLAQDLRGYEKSASPRFFIKQGRLSLRPLRAQETGGKGSEEGHGSTRVFGEVIFFPEPDWDTDGSRWLSLLARGFDTSRLESGWDRY